MYDKLVVKVNNIDTSDFALKTKYNTGKTELEKKIPDVTNFVEEAKLTELGNKNPDISNTKITEVENKPCNHNHDKYITTPEFNTSAADVFNARIVQTNLITKTDFDAKLSEFWQKNYQKSKHLLVKNELNKLKTFDLSYYRGKNYFEEDGAQKYLVFQPMYKCFKQINNDYVSSWKSKGLSNENITDPSAPNNFLNLSLEYLGTKLRVRFSGSCLKQDAIRYNHGKISKYLHCLWNK